jgi:4-methylaminobutanoate oxidase (formaldehyde-forming)
MGYVMHEAGVDQALIDGARFEIVVADKTVSARASLKPFYDPKNERMKM